MHILNTKFLALPLLTRELPLSLSNLTQLEELDISSNELNGFVRDILDILAQCNKLKLTPTCTSSLGFSRLCILTLGFIITQIIILRSYIIKL